MERKLTDVMAFTMARMTLVIAEMMAEMPRPMAEMIEPYHENFRICSESRHCGLGTNHSG
jgi:hypothetical protein